MIHLFPAAYASADRHGQGGGLAEEGKEIEVLEVPLDHAWAMAQRGEIVDAKTVILLLQLMLSLAGRA